jgi:hypothetical protein
MMMRQAGRRWLAAAMLMMSVVVPLLPTGVAQAAPIARAQWRGYFSNVLDTQGDNVIAGGINPSFFPLDPAGTPYVESFIATLLIHLNGSGRDQTGAEFIILTMDKQPPGTPRAVAHTAATLTNWENNVRAYADKGWVQWNTTISYTSNTYWQGNFGGGPDPDDDAWFSDVGSAPSIVFHQPGTAQFYRLRRACANPVGDSTGLNNTSYGVNLTADSNGSSLSVVAGKQYQIAARLTSVGPSASQPGTLQVMYPGTTLISRPCPVACGTSPPGQTTLLSGYSTGQGFRTASGIPGQAGQNWFWSVKAMGKGATTSGTIQFTVAPGAAVGSVITFRVYFYPGDGSGAVRSASVTYKVVSERTPAVIGNNGDIHAGGGLCGGALVNGSVKGFTNGGSGGQYVVSASLLNGINGFTSNGAGADTLKLGQSGAYAQTCRPDLLAAANAYWTVGAGYSVIGGNDFDVTGKSGVYFYNGGNLTIHGVVSGKVTVVARSGKVRVSGPITLSGATYAPHDVPSLGVIASGNIEIPAAVTRVDAYLFSNAVIDTCVEANGACATPTLVVNGFLMGKTLALHRLGPFNANGTPAGELVTLNPQIYLNPPKLFDASVDNTLLEGQGESQPLF